MVTGIGMVTPLAIGRAETWRRLLAGHRAGRQLTASDIDHFEQLTELLKRVPGGAPIDHDLVAKFVSESSLFDTVSQREKFRAGFGQDALNNLIAASLADALTDAGLEPSQLAGVRTGCVIGSSKASLRSMERQFLVTGQREPVDTYRTADLWHNGFMPDAPLVAVRHLTQAAGPSSCPVAACATGLMCAIEGAQLIASDLCDVCVVGSADASLRASVLSAFHRLGVTSRQADSASACRPFDQSRDGFIVGEGAAVVILESRKRAEQRGAECYAKLTAGLWLTDTSGMTQVQSDGDVVAELLNRLGGPNPCSVVGSIVEAEIPDIVSVHGTATETNDQAESRGIKAAYGDSVKTFGVKGAIGHLLGAAGSVELGLTLLSLRHKIVPGTANYATPDSLCPVAFSSASIVVPKATKAVKLSLGFGGHVVACSLKRI